MSMIIAIPVMMSIMMAVPVATTIIIAVPVVIVAPEAANDLTGDVTSVIVADLCCGRIAWHINNWQCQGAGDKTCSAERGYQHCNFDIHWGTP
jgi:hypothetical protein